MGDFIRFGNNDKGNTNAFYASTFRPHPYHSPEFVACEYLFYLFSGDGAAAANSSVMYKFSLFSRIVVSLLLNGKKHTRINAMGIMKITLWSRNDTWEPDNRMWHIQFYGSIYDPPHEKGSHTQSHWHSVCLSIHILDCAPQSHVFRRKSHELLWVVCLLRSTPSSWTLFDFRSEVNNSLNQTNAFCTYFHVQWIRWKRFLLFARHQTSHPHTLSTM